jgi:isopenicillin-N N-acyltransferase like protein
MFPVVTVLGSPHERGVEYGTQARDRVRTSIAAYADLFLDVCGWDWRRATSEAGRFKEPIRDFGEEYVDELAGIAEGAGVAREDILTINLRTEILFAAQVRAALEAMPLAECTAFASVAPDGHIVVGQNWDWMPFARDTVVVLRAEPDDGPTFVTVVEAGLLAKCGVNSAGVAVLTSALACREDQGQPGVPYHVLLRALLGSESTDAAVDVLTAANRASSANYLLADSTGAVVDVEARPGGPDTLHQLQPDAQGLLVHTNHFVSSEFDTVDYADLVESTSQFRQKRVRDLLSESPASGGRAPLTAGRATASGGRASLTGGRASLTGGRACRDHAAAALSDHADAPGSVCRHPIRSLPMSEQVETVASVLIDLTTTSVELSEGPPCERGYEALAFPTANGESRAPTAAEPDVRS